MKFSIVWMVLDVVCVFQHSSLHSGSGLLLSVYVLGGAKRSLAIAHTIQTTQTTEPSLPASSGLSLRGSAHLSAVPMGHPEHLGLRQVAVSRLAQLQG